MFVDDNIQVLLKDPDFSPTDLEKILSSPREKDPEPLILDQDEAYFSRDREPLEGLNPIDKYVTTYHEAIEYFDEDNKKAAEVIYFEAKEYLQDSIKRKKKISADIKTYIKELDSLGISLEIDKSKLCIPHLLTPERGKL